VKTASTERKVQTAAVGLGDLIDDCEFQCPQELSRRNLKPVQHAKDAVRAYELVYAALGA